MIGIVSALGASLSWTFACFIWREQTIFNKPLEINFLKNIIAFLIFSPILFFINFNLNTQYIIILCISGIIGIGLGDTFYLKSLNIIGTRKTLSIEAISPIIAAIVGELFINEYLSLRSWVGILIVSSSLFVIIKRQSFLSDGKETLFNNSFKFKNYMYAFLSVLCAVAAALLSRLVLISSQLTPIQTTEIRLAGAIFFLLLISKCKPNFFIRHLNKKTSLKFIISVFLGTNIGIYLQQVVFETLPLGIGWALLSSSPLFSLLFAKREEGILTKDIIFLTFSLFVGIILIIL